ncbi:MAG TPA: Nif3-like dinuclear metal center hexameric protein, partial [Puia sp.]|nr:Nif3-like dinuclear metal center hexameric protein [Puia sp.]
GAGAGNIGKYSECSFGVEGTGTFKGEEGAQPFVGHVGLRHSEKEVRLEVILPVHLSRAVVAAMIAAHPYEEVAYDLVPLANVQGGIGAGLVGELVLPMEEEAFLGRLCGVFGVPVVRHTRLTGQPVRRVAVCGGAGSFLISNALAVGANFYITSDVKYHEFMDANDRLVIADIGHWESEQFTVDLLIGHLREKFSNFAVLKSDVRTNPVHYHVGVKSK